MKICDPTGVIQEIQKNQSSIAVHSLAGKAVGILTNVWPSYTSMIGRFQEQLVEKHKVSKINHYEIPRTRAASDDLLDKVAAECDVVIVGLGN